MNDARTGALRRPAAEDRVDPEGQLSRPGKGGAAGKARAAPLVAGRFPRVKPSVSVFTASDGAIYLLRPSGEDLMIQSPPRGVALLLHRLDGTRTTAALAAEFAGRDDIEVAVAVEQLWALGFLEDARGDGRFGLSVAEVTRYDRQLAYFAELGPAGAHREELQARLARAQVTVIGVGGLGCWTAIALACAGIGRMVLVDGDVVETSNLNRQMLFTPADVGKPKAEVAALALSAFNPLVEIVAVSRRLESEQAIVEVADGSDVVAELADWPVDRIDRWMAGAASRLDVPYVQASQDPPIVRVGPTYVPGKTGCAECDARRHRKRHPLYDELVAYRATRTDENPTFGPACAIIGGMLANEITNLLLGLSPPATQGRAATVDLRTLEWSWSEPIARDPECDVCGSHGVVGTPGADGARPVLPGPRMPQTGQTGR